MIIDAHQHFWTLDTGFYNWITPEMTVLNRNYQPDDLMPTLTKNNVGSTILVQAAPLIEESKLLLSIAEQYNVVKGVVGWIDMESATAADDIAQFAIHPLFRGIRPMIQDIQDDEWILKKELAPAFEALQQQALCFDALVFPRHLRHLMTLVARYPQLPIVIDHIAKPAIAKRALIEWRAVLRELAQAPSVYCKLSGLLTEAGAQWTNDCIYPYMDVVFECFGTERVIWGSDWPVLLSNSSYETWLTLCQGYVDTHCAYAAMDIFAGNAQRFYRLNTKVPDDNTKQLYTTRDRLVND
ncbi:MAG: amidohydrolase [Coxiella sp. (in: Bacteria)]|nr:MAG: amidohydrolase [Coxiella sp. (in: g-proteobacteria)]